MQEAETNLSNMVAKATLRLACWRFALSSGAHLKGRFLDIQWQAVTYAHRSHRLDPKTRSDPTIVNEPLLIQPLQNAMFSPTSISKVGRKMAGTPQAAAKTADVLSTSRFSYYFRAMFFLSSWHRSRPSLRKLRLWRLHPLPRSSPRRRRFCFGILLLSSPLQ